MADAEHLKQWLATAACEAERRPDSPDLVRDEFLGLCRAERTEQPAAGRIDRIVRSVLHQDEQALTSRLHRERPVAGLGTRKCLLIWDDLACLGSRSSRTEGTFRVQGTRPRPKVVVAGDARGVVGHAGARLLTDLAHETGLTSGSIQAAGLDRQRRPAHAPGRGAVDLAVLVAD